MVTADIDFDQNWNERRPVRMQEARVALTEESSNTTIEGYDLRAGSAVGTDANLTGSDPSNAMQSISQTVAYQRGN